jgi:hypothetical protein
MPTNTQMERCISSERGALVFRSPEVQHRKPGRVAPLRVV